MQTNNTFSIIFFTRKSRNAKNQVSIYVRITVNKQRSEISLKRNVLFKEWDNTKNRGRGNFEPLKNVDSLVFEPGEKFEYSNPAYNGLALIIEQVSQKKWQDFIAEKIFKPSGMSDSRITDGDYPTKDVSHAYIKADGRYKEFDYGEYPTFAAAGNGGVWCSVLDLAKYELAIRNNLFLSKQTIEKSRTILSPKNWKDTTPPKIGYSWFIQDKNDKKKR